MARRRRIDGNGGSGCHRAQQRDAKVKSGREQQHDPAVRRHPSGAQAGRDAGGHVAKLAISQLIASNGADCRRLWRLLGPKRQRLGDCLAESGLCRPVSPCSNHCWFRLGFNRWQPLRLVRFRVTLHDIGKHLVAMMLEGAGFAIKDLGVNVDPEKFVQAAKEGAQIVAMSALLTTTMPGMKKTIDALQPLDCASRLRRLLAVHP